MLTVCLAAEQLAGVLWMRRLARAVVSFTTTIRPGHHHDH
jgi:hypothetical protein